MLRALYGHPLAGTMWYKRLMRAVKSMGLVSVEGVPCTFFDLVPRAISMTGVREGDVHGDIGRERLSTVLVVYVDDTLASGRKARKLITGIA
eukprot:1623996-Amphidinium_carterae.1